MMFRWSWSTPMLVRWIISTTSRSIPRGTGEVQDLLVSCRQDEHFGKDWLVSVNDDIDVGFGENAEVDLPADRRRRPEHDVLEFGGDHRPPPAVGQSRPGALEHDVPVILVDAHARPVDHLHDLAIYPTRRDTEFAPDRLPFLRGYLDIGDLPLLPAEIGQGAFGQLEGDLFVGLVFDRNPEDLGDPLELPDVTERIPGIGVRGRQEQGLRHLPSMVGVGGRPGGDHSGEIPGDDHLGGRAADSFLRLFSGRVDAAWPHVAGAAAESPLPESAVGLLLLSPVPDRFDAQCFGPLEHLIYRTVNAFWFRHHLLSC